MPAAENTAEHINRDFYERELPGLTDYWKKMAAPRFRVQTVLEQLRQRKPSSVVDLGCGGGQLLDEVRHALPQARLVGIDLSERQIADNRAHRPDIRWLTANLEQPGEWPADDRQRYAAVTAVEVIEHLDHPEIFLKNARALLAPGGFLLLSTQSGTVGETERRVGHRRHFTPQAISALLDAAGFAVERVWNTGFPFHDLSKWYANLDPDGSMNRFGDKPYGLREDLICLGLRALFRLNSNRRGAQLFAVGSAR
jgi:2-polyprenyl-3-methyl-5-hydroxy-6-metoxy-1,4-benzoquinol methylase